jgi:hypothetical protein
MSMPIVNCLIAAFFVIWFLTLPSGMVPRFAPKLNHKDSKENWICCQGTMIGTRFLAVFAVRW